MAIVIKPKRSETGSSAPTTADIAVGEIAVNTADRKIYIRDSSDAIKAIQGGMVVTDTDSTATVDILKFADTSSGLFTIDTSSESNTAIVRMTYNSDQDYGSIADSVGSGNNIDYGSL